MARGLGTGLLHGALLGAVVLAGLSLWAPLPQDRQGPLTVDLPVGSEFGRGDDHVPQAPAADAATPRAAAAPVMAPAPETAPTTGRLDTARPDATLTDRLPAPQPPAPDAAMPQITRPATAAPAARDTASPLAPAPGADRDSAPRIAADPDRTPVSVPALPSPALDLSLPPDLSDLQTLERD